MNKSWGSKWQKTGQQCKKELLRQAASSTNLTDNVLRKRSQTEKTSVNRKLQNCWDQPEAPGADQWGTRVRLTGKMGYKGNFLWGWRSLVSWMCFWLHRLQNCLNLKNKQGKGCHYVAQANLKLMILQPQMPQGWDHRHAPLYLVEFYYFLFFPFLIFFFKQVGF